MDNKTDKTFAIVAGEASGDILGAGLIRALRSRYPNASFVGIGGPKMLAEDFETLFPIERLSVMGLVEVLGRIRELIHIRKSLYQRFSSEKPTAFIGIDAPDFNIGLELKLRKSGVTTLHYVSPSVWAWRQKRIFKIRKAVDHMLAFLPFETAFYEKHNVPVTFTGHPLADEIPLDIDAVYAKKALGYLPSDTLIGLLPGSRGQEVKRLAPLFLEAAVQMKAKQKTLKFIIPCANEHRHQQITQLLSNYPTLDVQLTMGNSHEVMAAADALLLASGTAALEGMLNKKPMVVSYKLSWLTWQIAKRIVKTPWCSLPNILANKALIPEILQDEATPERLADETLQVLQQGDSLKKTFYEWHINLKCHASERAAEAIDQLITQNKSTSSCNNH